MATYKTPGVFIEEISTLGSSIAGVETAVAGFVGYTEKATFLDGTSALNKPVRITSLLEFQEIFGGPNKEKFKVTLTGTVPTPTSFSVAPVTTISNFILFYQIQMFYANGGGVCYIVSVGTYSTNPPLTPTLLTNAIDKFEQIDEITILSAPEAVFLMVIGDRKVVYQRMAAQCAKLQDRFAILDVVHNGNSLVVGNNTIFEDATDFRNNDIGPDNLKYVATYYPGLNTPLEYFYLDTEVVVTDSRTGGSYNYNGIFNKSLFTINNGVASYGKFEVLNNTLLAADTITINGVILTPGVSYAVGLTAQATAINIVNAINSHPTLSLIVNAYIDTVTPDLETIVVQSKIMGTPAGNYAAVSATPAKISFVSGGLSLTTLDGGKNDSADKALYNLIKAELSKYRVLLYPTAAMAGTYARVDANRGVWKAPANIGLALVNEPAINITDEDQQNLNVDSTSGKSINAIREFAGRGTLVWGARTLAGNDNEWRYINVRRLFTYVEESSKKATEFVVFEGNNANTWQRVKGMIEAFLTGLWRDGALVGPTPQQAFFVRVGLGTTMTPQDILEGKMIVQIGMAASRPAEFIILQFSHKLQES